jgi:hypothetical protein
MTRTTYNSGIQTASPKIMKLKITHVKTNTKAIKRMLDEQKIKSFEEMVVRDSNAFYADLAENGKKLLGRETL